MDRFMGRLTAVEEEVNDLEGGYDQFDADAILERLSRVEGHLSTIQKRLDILEAARERREPPES